MPREVDRIQPSSPDEAASLVEELGTDNERMRIRILELLEAMEELMTAKVADERALAELRNQLEATERELAAVRATATWRLAAPLRAAYGRFRRRIGR